MKTQIEPMLIEGKLQTDRVVSAGAESRQKGPKDAKKRTSARVPGRQVVYRGLRVVSTGRRGPRYGVLVRPRSGARNRQLRRISTVLERTSRVSSPR